MSVFLLILGLVLFIGLILIHEWGHFVAARRGGVEVEEYGVFFPPRLYKRKMKDGWLFTINLIPLGGFVKLKGEHDTDTGKGSFGAASLLVKTQIMAAGVFMNLLTAYVLLVFLALVGMPKLLDNQFTVKSDTKVVAYAQHYVGVDQVMANSPAARAGLKKNDNILAVGPAGHLQVVPYATDLKRVTAEFAGQTVQIKYQRDNQTRVGTTVLNSEASQQGKKAKSYLGVGIQEFQKGADMQRSTWSAPIVGAGLIGQFTAKTFQGLGSALHGLGSLIAGAVTGNTVARQNGQAQASDQVSGPIGIVVVLHYVSQINYQFTLLIIALISLTLAIMNILPIPALDGGRLWITLISRLFFRKPLAERTEEIVNATGFVVLILLSIVVAVVDVKRFF